MDHALLSPSSSKRWFACPGSAAKSKGLDEETVFGLKGTFGHEVAAGLLLSDAEADSKLGFTNGQFTFDEDLAGAVQIYLDAVRAVLLLEGGELAVEEKVGLTPNVYGTADALIWTKGRTGKPRLHVLDLKLGAGVYVPVEDNSQLLIYAVAAMAEKGLAPQLMDSVVLHIVQPLYKGAAPHRTEEVTPERLADFRRQVAAAELAAMKPNAPLAAGDHCRFCPARHTCEAFAAQAMAVAQELFPTADPAVPASSPPLVELMNDDQLAVVLANAALLESWVKSVRAEALDRAKNGRQLPGYKLVAKLGNRQWTDNAEAAKMMTAFGVDPFEHKLLSPAKAEKAIPGVKARVKNMTLRPERGVMLVAQTDRRPAIEGEAVQRLLDNFDDETDSED